MRRFVILGLTVLAAGCGRGAPTMAHGQPVDHWVRALHDPQAKVRKKAVTVLGNVGDADPAVIPALIGAVRDRDAEVRGEAILALMKLGPAAREATAVLKEACQDKDAKVRAYAVKTLERMQGDD
jgi:vesicle coat complex subunit